MKVADLLNHYPLLWHMAAPDSWESIKQRGLLSTSKLLDEYGVPAAKRAAIESTHRPECVELDHESLPKATIRDQKPMSDRALTKCLKDGLSPSDWYLILNSRVFFWLSRTRLRRLLSARAYRNKRQTLLTIDTRSLVEAYSEQIELCAYNSGSTIMKPVVRGLDTFLSIEEYDFEAWRERRGPREAVVELTVLGGVPDIARFVLAVHDWDGSKSIEVWRGEGVDPSIEP